MKTSATKTNVHTTKQIYKATWLTQHIYSYVLVLLAVSEKKCRCNHTWVATLYASSLRSVKIGLNSRCELMSQTGHNLVNDGAVGFASHDG